MKEKQLIKRDICPGLQVQRGKDGHWLCFEGNGKHGMINIENSLKNSIARDAIIGWIEGRLKDPQ